MAKVKKKAQQVYYFPFKKFLFFNIPNGWKDLGKVSGTYVGDYTTQYKTHAFCREVLHVVKMQGNLYYMCPKCKCNVWF